MQNGLFVFVKRPGHRVTEDAYHPEKEDLIDTCPHNGEWCRLSLHDSLSLFEGSLKKSDNYNREYSIEFYDPMTFGKY